MRALSSIYAHIQFNSKNKKTLEIIDGGEKEKAY
jgi:hypothetical protein